MSFGRVKGQQPRQQASNTASPAAEPSPVAPSVQGTAKGASPRTSGVNDSFGKATLPIAAPSVETDTQRLATQRAISLNKAFDAGDAKQALALLRGGTAEANAALMKAYASRFGRDLEYDMRGFALDLKGPLDFRGLSPTLRGLKGADLQEGFRLLHGPRLEANAARIAKLVEAGPTSTPQGRREIYDMLGQAGGEERALLSEIFQRQTGKDLVSTLKPARRRRRWPSSSARGTGRRCSRARTRSTSAATTGARSRPT